MVVKTAIALFNVQKTGENVAIFKSMEIGRDWPFVLPWMKGGFPSAISIDGPMLKWPLDVIHIFPSECVGILLQRMKEDQMEVSNHIHAPWFKGLDRLGDEGPMISDAAKRQWFSWDISLQHLLTTGGSLSILQPVGHLDWPDVGELWLAGMLNDEDFCIALTYDEMPLSLSETESHADSLLDIVSWLSEPGNWDISVGERVHKPQ